MLVNVRFSKNKNIVADREHKGSSSVKVIATPGYKGVYKFVTSSQAAQELAKEFGEQHDVTFQE
jgi:hypothetical protein